MFPITLSAYQDCWSDWYKEEETNIRNVQKQNIGNVINIFNRIKNLKGSRYNEF